MHNLFKIKFILSLFCVLIQSTLLAQDDTRKPYSTTSVEWIFSYPNLQKNGNSADATLRFSPAFNAQYLVHRDLNTKVGYSYGVAVRNLGFIYGRPNAEIKKKYRTYNLALPLALKFGKMHHTYFQLGYEIEMPVHYLEKTFFEGEKKEKYDSFFSERVPELYHSVFAGIQFRRGVGINFKYYLNNFLNTSYVATDNAGKYYRPFEGLNVHIFYFSLQFVFLKGKRINGSLILR